MCASTADKLKPYKLRDPEGDYVLVDHSKLIQQQLPIVKGQSASRIQRRLTNLSNLGILNKKIVIDQRTKRYKSYFRLSKYYHNLVQWWKDKIDLIKKGVDYEEIKKMMPLNKISMVENNHGSRSRDERTGKGTEDKSFWRTWSIPHICS